MARVDRKNNEFREFPELRLELFTGIDGIISIKN